MKTIIGERINLIKMKIREIRDNTERLRLKRLVISYVLTSSMSLSSFWMFEVTEDESISLAFCRSAAFI